MISGFLTLNKEKGMTSGCAVSKVKKLLRLANVDYGKIGHLGTLDPDGEGVLPLALGRATRLFDVLNDKTKVYETVFRFGETSDTLDASGTIVERSDMIPTRAEIEAVLPEFIGEYGQMPPQYSAKSVDGVRAYKLARQGIEVVLQVRKIRVEKFECMEMLSEREYRFRVTCGGGTYVRALARDLAIRLGTVGLMCSIKRTKSGPFTLEKSYTLSQLAETDLVGAIYPMSCVLSEYLSVEIPHTPAGMRFYNGIPLKVRIADGTYRLEDKNALVGLGTVAEGELSWKVRLI